MQYHRFTLLLALTLPLAYAEPAADHPSQGTGIQILRFTAQFRTRFGRDFAPSQLPKAVSVYRLDPAYLLGRDRYSGVSRVLQVFSIRRDELVIDLDDWTKIAHAIARPLARSDVKQGISVSPAETRVALVHPLTYLSGDGRVYGRHVGRYTELQTTDRQPASLVFFDRPCRVSGKIELMNNAGDLMHVELDVPGPGFYFLRQVQLPDRERSLVIDPTMPEVVFVTVF